MELTKWPRLLVEGEPVTEQQANEILIRTNSWFLSSNDRAWEELVYELAGIERTGQFGYPDRESLAAFRERAKVLDLSYLDNERIVSSWIGGPKGWCDWDGTIGATNYNIGKWPALEHVTGDWQAIAAAFPYLSLRAQLAPDEGQAPAVVEWRVQAGRVHLMMADFDPIRPTELADGMILARLTGAYGERGVSADRLRQALKQVVDRG
jgi:hypothetical protein